MESINNEKVRIVGIRSVEHYIREAEKPGKHHRNLTRGEKKVLRELGSLLFLQGHIWTLDNVALQDDPRCTELEKHLRVFVENYCGEGIMREEDMKAGVAYLAQLDKKRQPAPIPTPEPVSEEQPEK